MGLLLKYLTQDHELGLIGIKQFMVLERMLQKYGDKKCNEIAK